jgi:hypothetical protein
MDRGGLSQNIRLNGLATARSALGVPAGASRGAGVRSWQILLQKSKIEQPKKSRESRPLGFSAAASLFSGTTEIRDRFWMKRYGSLTSSSVKRISGSRNFRSPPQKDFCNNIGAFRT